MAVYVIRLFNQLDFVKQWFARFGADRFESVAEFFYSIWRIWQSSAKCQFLPINSLSPMTITR